MLIVINPLKPTKTGLISLAFWRNSCGGTSEPRSTTLNPCPCKSETTKHFPMSWMSPSTVPINIVPLDSISEFSLNEFFNTLVAALMASPVMSRSGRKYSSSSYNFPASSAPLSIAPFKISLTWIPFLIDSLTDSIALFVSPTKIAPFNFSNDSSFIINTV